MTPLVLIILDGWGVGPSSTGNAIGLARLQVFPRLMRDYPHALLHASGAAVGLPPRQHGNSEAGHINIGAGRVVEQDALRIDRTIEDGSFFRNPALVHALRFAKTHKSQLHLMGLLTGEESGHAYPKHILALLKAAKEADITTYLHLFTDGRDSEKYEAVEFLHKLEQHLAKNQKVATIIGRFWAMDRAKRWSRTEAAFNALVLGEGKTAPTAEAAILSAYKRGESDEFISPTVLGGTAAERRASRINDHDVVIFYHLRSDRARQLTKTFTQDAFEKMNPGSFRRKRLLKKIQFVALTDFGPDLTHVLTAFPNESIKDTLPMVLSGMKQLYIAESEKFAHVTFFLNGGYPHPVANEDRVMIPSSDVPSFDQTPAMQTPRIVRRIVADLAKKTHDVIVVNIASADMVGHTGNLQAGIESAKIIDACLGELETAIRAAGGTLIITADHGNLENMLDTKSGEINTEHSSNPVPFIIVSNTTTPVKLARTGKLGDIAPTILALLGKKKPRNMTGHSLIQQ